MNAEEVRKIRAEMAEELLKYRKVHSAVYGDMMTYADEGKYLKEIASKVYP